MAKLVSISINGVKIPIAPVTMSYGPFGDPYGNPIYDPFPTKPAPAPAKLGDRHPDKTCKKCGNKGHVTTARLSPTVLICKLCGKEDKP